MAEEGGETLRTLIVDDEPLAVERMQVICSKIGQLQVVGTASDGAQALRLVDALQPDLMLLDMTMPEVDGISVAKALSKKPQRPAVVFVTAHDNYAVEAFDLDAVDYVLKPVKAERLERAVSRAFARRGDGEHRSQQAFLVPPGAARHRRSRRAEQSVVVAQPRQHQHGREKAHHRK